MGSDISVTVVQKKKETSSPSGSSAAVDNKPSATANSAAGAGTTVAPAVAKIPPRISVKKESELLEGGAAIRRSIEEVVSRPGTSSSGTTSTGKSPPDPIVTISKVSQQASSGTATASASPAAQQLKPSPGPPQAATPSTSKGMLPPRPGSASSSGSPSAPAISQSLRTATTSAPSPTGAGPISSLANLLGGPRVPGPYGGPMRMPGAHGMRHPGPPHGPPMRHGPGLPPPGMRGPSPQGGSMGMPSLQPRPPAGPLSAPPPPTPASVGPVTEQLNKVAGKLADFMRNSIEDLFKEMAVHGSPEATIKALQVLLFPLKNAIKQRGLALLNKPCVYRLKWRRCNGGTNRSWQK